jgi:hypothetical protein
LELTEAMKAEIVRLRQAHPTWGGKKLRRLLMKAHGEETPSVRTLERVMGEFGLIRRHRWRERSVAVPGNGGAITVAAAQGLRYGTRDRAPVGQKGAVSLDMERDELKRAGCKRIFHDVASGSKAVPRWFGFATARLAAWRARQRIDGRRRWRGREPCETASRRGSRSL